MLILFLLVSLTFAQTCDAAITFDFGGKVLKTKITGVTCNGNGTLMILSSNADSAGSAVSSVAGNGASTGQKVVGGITGILGLVPFYATNANKKPKPGEWILGKANAVPDLSTCKLKVGKSKIPIPVRKTSYYNISK